MDPSQLNFSYKIDGPNVPWQTAAGVRRWLARLSRDAGRHEVEAQAPALLIGAAGGTQMVNYRVRGSYFVVDRLFEQGVLLAGVGRQQDRVMIAYAGGSEVRKMAGR